MQTLWFSSGFTHYLLISAALCFDRATPIYRTTPFAICGIEGLNFSWALWRRLWDRVSSVYVTTRCPRFSQSLWHHRTPPSRTMWRQADRAFLNLYDVKGPCLSQSMTSGYSLWRQDDRAFLSLCDVKGPCLSQSMTSGWPCYSLSMTSGWPRFSQSVWRQRAVLFSVCDVRLIVLFSICDARLTVLFSVYVSFSQSMWHQRAVVSQSVRSDWPCFF